ncbi:ferrous iron transport protein B [Ruminococcus sp.]|uniref:ferrous iron transport protein B n=1 Tax=Ruminococcus sp. TaxID=41978 RepID=UPI003890F899
MTLKDLKQGQSAVITTVGGDGSLRQHFLDMGVIPGAQVTFVKLAPLGDPMQLRIHGYELTLRLDDAQKIGVMPIEKTTEQIKPKRRRSDHPGLGEEGRFHKKGSGDPLPDNVTLTFALVGNQNSGKTTLFNQLTGANRHVGNFPGVTVDRKDGVIKGHPNTLITDLPGIYSMSPYSGEEIVSRNFVLQEKPKAIINIVDATNIERNLYLTMQLLEMDTPMVVALNIMDEVTANGGSVDINTLEELLGVPVVPISAAKNEGVAELVRHAVHIAHYQEKPRRQDFCDATAQGGALHRCLHAISHLIEDKANKAQIPLRFAASKLIEGDGLVREALALDDEELETVEHIVSRMEKERGLDRNAAIADMRFDYIMKVCAQTVSKPAESREHKRSSRIDRILTGRFTALPMFLLIMAAVFYLTFELIGGNLQALLGSGLDALSASVRTWLTSSGVNAVITGLLTDGILAGVGSVLSFLPIIVTLFFFLSILEDTGYLARVAFFMDKLLRRIGLSGRSIVPMLIGFGCTVPAVMATRTLPSQRDRRMTILLTPFMSCTAKLPIYSFFVNAFFEKQKWLIITGLYILGILIGLLAALVMKKTHFKGEAVPFVMELPNYRLPGAKNVLRLLWEKAKDFLQRAFTIIFIATIVVWFLRNFDFHLNMVENSQGSILSVIAGFIAPLFTPVGLGDWRLVTSLISGFIAKESVVAAMEVLYPGGIAGAITALTAVSMLVFSLLYTPCVAAITSVKRELGVKWAVGTVVWQCAIAYLVTMAVYYLCMLCGL